MTSLRLILVAVMLKLFFSVSVAPAEQSTDYLKQVKPLLAERCFACHGALEQNSGLRLDAGALILAGGDSGEVVVPGKPEESLLIDMITGEAGLMMPPEGEGTPLKAEEIELVKRWIAQGATFPETDQPEEDPRDYWSYQRVVRPPVPDVPEGSAAHNPIDTFINARLAEHKLTPVGPAEPHTLLRRVYLDLIGLPPTKAQLEAFLQDPSDEAYEAVVDLLLASPQYGERWGRHWMDVWRYSDWYGSTAANQIRNSQYHIWHWRDWIVESLNADKGYDQMLQEMLAADELAPDDRDALRATGYLARSWYKFNRTTWLIDTVEHFNMAFLGVTMKCARCHDHKFDPIKQSDYYQFRAIFEPHDVRTDPFPDEMDVTKNGLPRVYDKSPDDPTYLFTRGDERMPEKENPLPPGVPAALDKTSFAPAQVSLPLEARYLQLQPDFLKVAEDEIQKRIHTAQEELAALESRRSELQAKAQPIDSSEHPWRSDVVREADAQLFQQFEPGQELSTGWEQLAGKWNVDNQLLRPDLPAGSATAYLATKGEHPENFYARLVYRTLQPGNYRSIGFSFDFQQPGESQDIYTSTGDERQSVQAFHRIGGKDIYPYSGIVRTPIKLGEETTVEVVVRGRDLRIWLNDELKLDYILPKPRRRGQFAVWVYQGTAEFSEIEIHALEPTSQDYSRRAREIDLDIEIKLKEIESIEAELTALHTRAAAERAKYESKDSEQAEELAIEADKAEKLVGYLEAQREDLATNHYLELVTELDPSALQGEKVLLADAQQSRASTQASLATSQEAMTAAKGEYQPLGEPYPAESTGRRLALARWMTGRENPRTARVAVNHLWLRHFGKAIVPNVSDLGIRSQPRSHPLLLDWLAAELMESGWKMKPLHKSMVMSHAYRRDSAVGDQKQNLDKDPGNIYLWRMNSRRLEAESIRDSVLYASGKLDLTTGGPTLPQTQGHSTYRRSMYYQLTPDNKMDFLAQFDVASPIQCYQRKASVVPQQALALSNSILAQNQARHLAKELASLAADEFVAESFARILSRLPNDTERELSSEFLYQHAQVLTDLAGLTPMLPGEEGITEPAQDPQQRARENFVQVLFNHNDFVTVR